MGQRLGCGKLRTLEVKTLWLQQCLQNQSIIARKIPGEHNVADLGTKFLDAAKQLKFHRMVGGELLLPDERPRSEGVPCVGVCVQ